MKNFRLFLAAVVTALPLTAMADISFYAAFGVGGARLEEDLNVTVTVNDLERLQNGDLVPVTDVFPANGDTFPFQGTDLAVRLFAGVRFGDYFGLEGGYVTFGEAEDNLDYTIPFGPRGCNPAINFDCVRPETSRSVTYTDEIDGWEVYAVGAFPITENLEVFGKAGVLIWESTFTSKDVAQIFPPQLPNIEEVILSPAGKVETDGTDFAGGGGINYKMTEHTSLRFEGTWYDIDGTDMLLMLNGGFIYEF